MPVYRYEALDRSGATVRGTLDSPSDEEARLALKDRGLFPVDLGRQEVKTRAPLFSLRPSARDLSLFARQMSTLTEAGFTMLESLGTVLGQTANLRFAGVVADLKDRVHRGEGLSQAMGSHPDVFPPMYVSMAYAGEQSGRLHEILRRVSDYLDRGIRLKNKVLVSLAYPALMTLVGAGILVFLITFIAPTLAEVFADGDQKLPFLTTALMETSRLLGTWWPLGVTLAALAAFLVRRWSRTPSGHRALDALTLKLPVLGRLATTIAMARFARTLGVLLEGGVEILQAFDITGRVLDNEVLTEALGRARAKVTSGSDLAGPLAESGLFPRLLVDMVAAGQKSGRLPAMLLKVADDLDEQVETQLSLFTALLEPFLILLMGVAVGTIVLAVVQPIFQMNRMY